LAVLLLYVRTPLYGSIAAIILAQVSINMVFGTRMLSGALIQVHRDLERAAEVAGVPRHAVMTRILMPIIRSQMFNGWLLVFAHSMRDLGVPLVFLTSQTVVLSSVLWLTWGYPNVPGAAALSVVMVVVLAVVVTPLQLYISRLDARAA
jgi:iron(III) transport system permease protein